MFFLIIHKCALVITILSGVFLCRKGKVWKKGHFASGLAAVLALLLYMFTAYPMPTGYIGYALLLSLALGIGWGARGKPYLHIILAIVALIWLVLIHIL